MNKLRTWVLCLLTLWTGGSLYAQDYSVVSGSAVKRHDQMGNELDRMYLFEVKNGSSELVASTEIRHDGLFTMAFPAKEEGFFRLSYNADNSIVAHGDTFYLKPGDNLNIEFSNESYKLIHCNTPENTEIKRWHDIMLPLQIAVGMQTDYEWNTYVDFFPVLEEKIVELKNYEQEYEGNHLFSERFRNMQRMDICNYAVSFIFQLNMAHPQGEDFPEFYKTITLENLSATCDMLDYPFGLHIIPYIKMLAPLMLVGDEWGMAMEYDMDPISFLESDLKALHGDRLKEEWIKSNIGSVKTRIGLMALREKYGKYLGVDAIAGLDAKISSCPNKPVIPGSFGAMELEDAEGGMVRLGDIDAKIIYVDFWATWCGPCIMEIPAMEALKERYKDNGDVAFVSISMDEPDNKELWKNMLGNLGMTGLQLFGGQSLGDIRNKYSVRRFPTFMIFARGGDILYGDAPRPSSIEIDLLLKDFLEQYQTKDK